MTFSVQLLRDSKISFLKKDDNPKINMFMFIIIVKINKIRDIFFVKKKKKYCLVPIKVFWIDIWHNYEAQIHIMFIKIVSVTYSVHGCKVFMKI